MVWEDRASCKSCEEKVNEINFYPWHSTGSRWNDNSFKSNEKKNNKDEEKQTNFVIAMDNYFTLPRVIKALCDKGIGIVGTAKY